MRWNFGYFVKGQTRVSKTQDQGQSSSLRGSSFDDFKKVGPPYFSSTSSPMEAKALILKIGKFFNVMNHFEKQ